MRLNDSVPGRCVLLTDSQTHSVMYMSGHVSCLKKLGGVFLEPEC